MLLRPATLLLVCTPALAAAQDAADLFSCLEPSRLAARTATYAVTGSTANYSDVEEVVAEQIGDRASLRITRTRSRDGVMTAAQILHVDARTLAPLTFVHNSARTPDKPPATLAARDGRLTGHSYGNQPVDVTTDGQPILFGSSTPDMIAATIDFERCPNVSALHLSASDGLIKRGISMKRVGEGAFTLQGRELPVYEVLVTNAGYESTLFVTRGAPHIVVKHVHQMPPATVELVRLNN